MKTIFKIAILSFMGITLSFTSHAQRRAQEWTSKSPGERAEIQTEWMKTELSLSDDQAVTTQEINLKYAEKVESLKSSDASRMEKFQELKAYDTAKDGELEKVFSDDQYKVYQKKKEKLRKAVRG